MNNSSKNIFIAGILLSQNKVLNNLIKEANLGIKIAKKDKCYTYSNKTTVY